MLKRRIGNSRITSWTNLPDFVQEENELILTPFYNWLTRVRTPAYRAEHNIVDYSEVIDVLREPIHDFDTSHIKSRNVCFKFKDKNSAIRFKLWFT